MIHQHDKAFTLIELILVIVIIAVLSLIAVPNFLEAQVRAKVARVHSDMRSVATAIESYLADYNREPIDYLEGQNLLGWGQSDFDRSYWALTTPVAYLTTQPNDPFGPEETRKSPVYRNMRSKTGLWDAGGCPGCPYAAAKGYIWGIRSRGPGGTNVTDFKPNLSVADVPEIVSNSMEEIRTYVYDPTNGSTSKGWIIRTNKGAYENPSAD